MSTKLTRDAYVALIEENVSWLNANTDDSLERQHIKSILWDSVTQHYGEQDT